MIYTITMGYVPARIWRHSAEAYYRTRNHDTQHFFVDQRYPLNETQNRVELHSICRDHNISILDPGRNLGGTEGFNYALRFIKPSKGDVIIGYDPDSFVETEGWDGALIDAIMFDDQVNWTSLMSARAQPELESRGIKRRWIRHLEVWQTVRPVVNSVCAFRAEWLTAVGGLSQPSPWYGGLEASMFNNLRGGQWCFLPGWMENDSLRDQQDREFLWWKWKHAHLGEWPGDFKSYVDAGCPPPSDLPKKLP